MDNITSEKYELYLKALNIKSSEIDMRLLIFKYSLVLCDYCDRIVYDIDELKLIVDAFLYFSEFKLPSNIDRQEEMLQNLLQNKKCIEDISDAEMIALYGFTISLKIVCLFETVEELSTVCPVLYKIFATSAPIEEYQKQHGDLKTLLKEMKKENAK